MKVKSFLARWMSRTLFLIFYLLDIAGFYYLTGNLQYTAAWVAAIWIILAIRTGFTLITLKAHSVKNATYSDAAYLQNCMEEVLSRSTAIGRQRIKIRLYIADNESLNCYAVGRRSIVVNRSMLRLGDRSILESDLGHQLSHIYNMDPLFLSILEFNLFIGIFSFGLALFVASTAVILITALIFGMFFSSWIGYTIGTTAGKAIKKCFSLILRGFYYVHKTISALLCRCQNFEADNYSVWLGYANGLLTLLQLQESRQRYAIETSWIEDLLCCEPSHYRRASHILNLKHEIDMLEEAGYEALPYENLFE